MAAPLVGAPPPPDMLFEMPVFAMPGGPNTMAGAPADGAYRNETLEPRLIEGLRAEGTRTTTTIAAGAMGNALPIEVVSERWYSPDLHVILMTRRYDPRFGETVYRLTNIDRSEPSPDLFKVPPDFKVQDMRRGRPMPVRPEER